ncbi:MAG: HD-GYP domain-containing protein [Bacillota bacterium]|nr:HD-GYP domain-containing protein [Bacillota bacterium]
MEEGFITLVPLDKVAPGMKAGRTVYDEKGRVLLLAGQELDSKIIKRLARFGVMSMYLQIPVENENGCRNGGHPADLIRGATRQKAIHEVKKVMYRVIRQKNTSIRKLEKVVLTIINELLALDEIIINLIDIRTLNHYDFCHCVNVCVFSLIIGISMGYNRESLLNLGMGAILHDLGKLKIPRKILLKREPLTSEEYAAVVRHTWYGYEALSRYPNVDQRAKQVVLLHHERFNGRGYPFGLRGKAIPDFARIAAVCDVYDALITDRIYRRRYSFAEANRILVADQDYFDPEVVTILLGHVCNYPPGTLVKLDSGQVGIVTETLAWERRLPATLESGIKIVDQGIGQKLIEVFK